MTDRRKAPDAPLPKTPTGVHGLDEVTLGGLPSGRPTLLCGAAGCGKTLLAMTFLVNGALAGDAGVFMSFEERADDLATNVASLGYEVDRLVGEKLLLIDHVRVERAEIEESGEYDLEGLFVRLGYAIDSVGAKRVVLDTIEALFGGFDDAAVLRAELRRLFSWLKDRGVTAIITGERGDGQLTRFGIEEYVSDCVILLDNRVQDQITTRRLRIVKYRGSAHGTNEYPFLIDDKGISVLPVTSAALEHKVSSEIVSTGVGGLDAMLGLGGFFKGASILISGLAGTGKSTFGASFVNGACSRGERAIFFAFEESPEQIVRNMASVGMDLQPHVDAGLLRFASARPSLFGLEMHLARMNRDIHEFAPSAVVVDPISAFRGPESEIHATLLRLVDICKSLGVTTVFTSLSSVGDNMSETDRGISSLMDSWVSLIDLDANGERNRILYVLKSRGMDHSKQLREYRLTRHGIEMIEAYIGPEGVLTGSARVAQEARELDAGLARAQDLEQRKRAVVRRRTKAEGQIAELHTQISEDEAEIDLIDSEARQREGGYEAMRAALAASRGVAPKVEKQ